MGWMISGTKKTPPPNFANLRADLWISEAVNGTTVSTRLKDFETPRHARKVFDFGNAGEPTKELILTITRFLLGVVTSAHNWGLRNPSFFGFFSPSEVGLKSKLVSGEWRWWIFCCWIPKFWNTNPPDSERSQVKNTRIFCCQDDGQVSVLKL